LICDLLQQEEWYLVWQNVDFKLLTSSNYLNVAVTKHLFEIEFLPWVFVFLSLVFLHVHAWFMV